MKWCDLMSGDKLKVRKEVLKYYDREGYGFNETWANRKLVILKIDVEIDNEISLELRNEYGQIGNFTINEFGQDPYSFCPYMVFFDIVELC